MEGEAVTLAGYTFDLLCCLRHIKLHVTSCVVLGESRSMMGGDILVVPFWNYLVRLRIGLR